MRGKKCVDEGGLSEASLPYMRHRSASVAAVLHQTRQAAAEPTDYHHIELEATLQEFMFDLPSDS